jgi:hypothetical protein
LGGCEAPLLRMIQAGRAAMIIATHTYLCYPSLEV